MKLKCLKCDKERELNPDEIKEVGDFITNKNIKVISVLKYFNMIDGETCGDDEHVYDWDAKFLTYITDKVNNLHNLENTINKNLEDKTSLAKQIDELQEQLTNINNEYTKLQNEWDEKEPEIYNETYIKWDKW